MTDPGGRLDEVWRASWGLLLGRLVARTGRVDLAEDALAQAFADAADQWGRDGVPDTPEAWIATVARRRVLDAIRSEALTWTKAHLIARPESAGASGVDAVHDGLEPADEYDDRIRLLFLATHPALGADARSALALRFVLGVPTERIARLFLVPTATMAARLTRAKRRIVATGIPFAMPPPAAVPKRVEDVAQAILLAFTAGYAPGDEHVVRARDAGEAVRLARVALAAMPRDPVFRALAALVTLQHSRRDARVGSDGSVVVLADQDRTRWQHDEIEWGLAQLDGLAPGSGCAEELRLQAVIAAAHAMAPTAAQTDWTIVARAYARLERLTGSPIVRLNRAIALAEVRGPQAGLALLRAVGDALPDHHRVALARAELLRRDGQVADAAAAYREALRTCPEGAERQHIARRLAELAG